MEKFLQSDIRKNIQWSIYWKKIFYENIQWRKYRWIKKTKKIWKIQISWYQIMWIDVSSFYLLKKDIKKIKKKYKWIFNIMFQLWITNEVITFDNKKQSDEFILKVKNKRLYEEKKYKKIWLKKSFKENMPLSNIFYDLNISGENLQKNMTSHARRYIRKWEKSWLEFSSIKKIELDIFYKKWKNISIEKWFWIIDKQSFLKIYEYLQWWKWDIFICKKWEDIVSWWIFVFFNDKIIYLYWFDDRKFWNIWWHEFLFRNIMLFAKKNKIWCLDMFWGSPTGFSHHLSWVSRFKESFWWKKIEFVWNFDIILNPILYILFKIYC